MKKKIRNIIWMFLFTALTFALPVSASAAEKGYSIGTGNTRVYSNTGLTSGYGWIYGSDEVTINQISSRYMKVTYPVSRGTKTGYVYTSAFLTNASGWSSYTARAKITTYRRPGGASYGYIAKNDTVSVLGTSGNYTQVKYPVSGGYKYAFVTTSDYNNYIKPASRQETTGGCRDIPDGWYMMVSGNSDDRVLDINNWNQNNGGNLETYAKNNTTNQRFYLHYLNNGYYSIRVQHSGRYLHVQDGNNRTSNVHQWEGYNHNNAQWALKSAGNGYYFLQCRGNGSFLDNSNASTALGNNVITYPYNASKAQQWKFLSTSSGADEKRSLSDGWYEIQSGNNTSYVWDINSASSSDGANLEIYQRHGGSNQKFYLKYLNNGYYAIMAGNSNKYMHKQNAGHTDNVVQWASYSTSAIQTQWAIASLGNGYYSIRSKAGNYIDNSGAAVRNGNNVITYMANGSNAQKWRFVSTSAPGQSTAPAASETYYVTTTAGLILRKGPGSSYAKIITMPYASAIQVSSISSGWAKAKYNGYEGYCSSSYISRTKPGSNGSGIPANKAITSYSQMDSRWRDVPYGYSDTSCRTRAYLGKGASGNVGSGCGVLALTNAVYYLNGSFIQPSLIASYSLNYGYRVNGVGTSYGLYKSFANNRGAGYGFAWVGEISSWSTLQSYLSSGKVAICGKSGHIMALVNYDPSTGRYLLLDSCPSRNRGTYGTGYVWATKSYLQNTVGIRSDFHILKSTR